MLLFCFWVALRCWIHFSFDLSLMQASAVCRGKSRLKKHPAIIQSSIWLHEFSSNWWTIEIPLTPTQTIVQKMSDFMQTTNGFLHKSPFNLLLTCFFCKQVKDMVFGFWPSAFLTSKRGPFQAAEADQAAGNMQWMIQLLLPEWGTNPIDTWWSKQIVTYL